MQYIIVFITQDVEIPDRYIVCGTEYKQLREVLTQVILGDASVEKCLHKMQVKQ